MTRIALLAFVAAALVAGCGGSADQTLPPELVTLRPAGTAGPLVGVDAPSGTERFAVHDGVASADGSRYYATFESPGGTELRAYRPATARLVSTARIGGTWRASAVSADGRFVALTGRPRGGRSTFAVHEAGAPLHVIELAGRFAVDGLAPDGSALYLVERFADGRYAVRYYDLAEDRLHTESIRVKNEQEQMSGLPGQQVATPDGTWLLTLFTNTEERKAFVHALNLRQRYALCLDLPGEGDVASLRGYGLALTPRGDALFAPNPALGVVVRLDLAEPGRMDTASFAGASGRGTTASAVSRDGRTVYFARDGRLWAYDAAYSLVRGPYPLAADGPRLAFSPDGRRLYALAADGRLVAFDAATGKRLAA